MQLEKVIKKVSQCNTFLIYAYFICCVSFDFDSNYTETDAVLTLVFLLSLSSYQYNRFSHSKEGNVDMMVDMMVDDWKEDEEEEDLLVLMDSMMVADVADDNGLDDKGNDEMVVVEDDYGMNDDYDGVDDVDDVDVDDDSNEMEEVVVVEHNYWLMLAEQQN